MFREGPSLPLPRAISSDRPASPHSAEGHPRCCDQHACVDGWCGTSYCTRIVRCQESTSLGNVGYIGKTAECTAFQEGVKVSFTGLDCRLQCWSEIETRGNGIDPGTRAPPLTGQVFRHRNDGRFGRAVGVQRRGDVTCDGRDVDDGARSARPCVHQMRGSLCRHRAGRYRRPRPRPRAPIPWG
ncbi:hypothetical protein OKW34_002795 [Paraburkholderia youngii]